MKNAPNPHWLETRWNITQENTEIFQQKLEQFGSLGSYQMFPLDEDAPLTNPEFIAYFPDQTNINAIAQKLQTLENKDVSLVTIKRIPMESWATEWKKHFKPFTLAYNIVIRPSWEPYMHKDNEIVLTLDPGMAFGTGQHDTTRFCVEYIHELKQQDNNLNTLIDVGCGSGILAILAKLIGFEEVVGIEVDAEAIETASENLQRNPQAKDIVFCLNNGPLNNLNLKPAHVVVANIIAETLCALKNDLLSLIENRGYLILSGILPERKGLIEDAFSDLDLVNKKQSENWYAYLYRKK
ncbi:MAG: 50S ribosomal protein L11 methyltransferase [bacterium]|nr:50S ribosomal protein L11 methyltransferase [bacterium]MBU1916700.1 50S ribosomal protein L11 methyltransferase [bacterium]